MSNKVYETVTNQIIAQLEKVNPNETKQPWFSVGHSPVNLRGTPYRGINHVLLSSSGFQSNIWATFNQWKDKECNVKKGENSRPVVFWKFFDETNEEGNSTGKAGAVMTRYFRVFNAQQVEGDYAQEVQEKFKDKIKDHNPVLEAEELINNYMTNERLPLIDSDRAYYSGGIGEHIAMPELGQFDSPESYYSVFAHEITHSTGNKNRLDRDMTGRFGDEKYAFEELIAELGSAMLCGAIGLEQTPRIDHAIYIKSWLTALRSEPKFIVSAASQTQKAADFAFQSADNARAIEALDASK